MPFSLYLGWITVATIANAAAVGNWAGITTFGIAPELVAALVLAVGLLIAVTVLLRTGDVAYGGVIVWAYLGIGVKEVIDAVRAMGRRRHRRRDRSDDARRSDPTAHAADATARRLRGVEQTFYTPDSC